jgi:hypothetical protein
MFWGDRGSIVATQPYGLPRDDDFLGLQLTKLKSVTL